MAKKLTHKERAKRRLESLGWEVGDVEKWLPYAKRRVDLFGILDLVAVKGRATLGVQVTDPTSVVKHVTKMLVEPRLWSVLSAKWKVELWGVRNKPVRDGSFAVVRSFELEDGEVAVYDDSSVLS